MKKQNKGFTLVELLIVIVIIGILAAIIIPSVSSAIDKANFASDQSDAKNMNTTLLAYCTTNGIDPSELEAPEVRSIVSSQDKNYTFVPKSSNGIFWYNTENGEIEVTQTGMPTATSKIGNAVYADGTIDSIEEIVDGYLYLNTQGELANWLRKLRSLRESNTYEQLVSEVANFSQYSRLAQISTKYDPKTTLFVNAVGGYTSYTLDAGSIQNIVFDADMRVIPKLDSISGIVINSNVVIRIPATVEVVLPEAFDGILSANKIEACKKTKFLEGSLSATLESVNSLSYVEIDKDALKVANDMITITKIAVDGKNVTEVKTYGSSDKYTVDSKEFDLYTFLEVEHCTVIALDKLGIKDNEFRINTQTFLTKYPNVTTLSIQQFVVEGTKAEDGTATWKKEYHVQAFDSTGLVLNVIIVVNA